MATRKLSPSLFSAKVGIAQTERSTQYLHFIAGVRKGRNQYAFVCECQPLLTLTGHGLPKGCPLCRQDDPIGSENQAWEEKRMIISRDNNGNIIGWRETYISKGEIVEVSVNGNINTINTRNRTTGKVESKTFFGKPLLPSAFSAGNK